ncbi:MAG: geranylgeranyl reductase family protein [Pseudolysinimonas sp.]
MADDARVWDVIVVGAGPAGSSAARTAASGGASVLLIDRAEFPRYKTCAGGLIGASLANIPDSVLEVVEDRPHRAIFTRRGRDAVIIERPDPFLGMVDRQRFDAALLDAAVAAGATFRGRVTLREVRDAGTHVELETTGGVLRAKVVVGADGSASRVARHVGVRYRLTDLGLEDEIRIDPSPWRGTILIDWGRVRGSYAWLFPKAEGVAIGVIQRTGDPDSARAYLAEWRTRLGLDGVPALHSSGHLTHSRDSGSPLRRGRVIVAGDAAGLLEPWLREGISFALRSGIRAGEAAAAATDDPDRLDDYVYRIHDELEPEQRAGGLLLTGFELFPRLIQWALARRSTQRFFVRYGRAETTLASFWRAGWIMRVGDLLARPFR